MRTMQILLVLLIGGCTGIGYVATSDPYRLLGQADSLENEDRLLLAEDVIGQALQLFQQKNDVAGMADAYHAYGNLYKSYGYHYGRWVAKFKQLGTWDGTFTKSIDNFTKAQRLFEDAGDDIGVVKSLIGAGNAYSLRKESGKACALYTEALTRYRTAVASGRPLRQHQLLTGYPDAGSLAEAFIKKEGCGT